MLRQIIRIGQVTESPPPADTDMSEAVLRSELMRTFGRSLNIRHVDAGSCNGCELEIHALSNPYYNLEGLGIKFVASPRHADALLVTGPVTRHMAEALQRTYAAVPDPKFVIALGDCAGGCGVFGETYAIVGKVSQLIPVDAWVPGCPPTPAAMLRGILDALRSRSELSQQAIDPSCG